MSKETEISKTEETKGNKIIVTVRRERVIKSKYGGYMVSTFCSESKNNFGRIFCPESLLTWYEGMDKKGEPTPYVDVCLDKDHTYKFRYMVSKEPEEYKYIMITGQDFAQLVEQGGKVNRELEKKFQKTDSNKIHITVKDKQVNKSQYNNDYVVSIPFSLAKYNFGYFNCQEDLITWYDGVNKKGEPAQCVDINLDKDTAYKFFYKASDTPKKFTNIILTGSEIAQIKQQNGKVDQKLEQKIESMKPKSESDPNKVFISVTSKNVFELKNDDNKLRISIPFSESLNGYGSVFCPKEWLTWRDGVSREGEPIQYVEFYLDKDTPYQFGIMISKDPRKYKNITKTGEEIAQLQDQKRENYIKSHKNIKEG